MEIYALLWGRQREGEITFPASVDSQLIPVQNNPYAKMVYFRGAYSGPLHNIGYNISLFLIVYVA